MNIAFDALPLLGRLTGVGYCEAGQVQELIRQHPQDRYTFNYFSIRGHDELLAPYLAPNAGIRRAAFHGYAYRLLSSFLPLPYSAFFGKKNDITHFFNYIVPPHVGGKTVVTVHDMAYLSCGETVRDRTRRMLEVGLETSMERADRIIAPSDFSRREIIRYFPRFEGKIRVVPCGVDKARFHPVTDAAALRDVRTRYGLGEQYFLYLGTIEPRKNLEMLIKAYYQFAMAHRTAPQLVLAGGKGWLYDSIFEQVQQLHLDKQIIFTEYVEDKDICAMMSGALAFVFPSLYEGFGIPPLEAMACGTPVLVSDAASLPEVTSTAAVIVRPDDAGSIAEGLHALYTDAALRERLRMQGMARAEQLSWRHSAELLYRVYEELL